MPEGPSLVLLKEAARPLAEGRRIERASGNTTAIDTAALTGRSVVSVRTWGKHFLLEPDSGCTVRGHFLLFGSFRIDDPKDNPPRPSHWQSECPRCHIPFKKRKLGRTARIAYCCERCQELFGPAQAAAPCPSLDCRARSACQ